MSTLSGHLSAQVPPHLSAADRLRSIKPLPTDRVSPQNQLKILLAWASESHAGMKPATVNAVASAVGMASSTVALTNPFFASIGLLQRLAVGTYIPSAHVIAFFNAKNQETAARKLAPIFQDAWFGQLLIPKLKFAPMDQQQALSLLEDACDAGQEQRKAVEFILDFMAEVKLIERDGNQIRLSPLAITPSQLTPTVSFDGTNYCVEVRVDSRLLAEHLRELFTSLAALLAKE